jgi:hypothetical protein
MKHTDEQIIATIRKILDVLHDPDKGFNAFRKELRSKKLSEKEYEDAIIDKQYEIAAKYGLTKENNESEVKFRLSGKDVMDNHLYVSCGQAAKAFCYVNSQLPKEEQLDLKVLFSTDIEHLIDAMEGHTLPCVQLSDGKWHAIEPQIQPDKTKQPGFEFVCDDVKVGGEIWHQLESIKKKGRPYQITKIVTPEEQLAIYSDFSKFLAASMVHKGKIAFICSELRIILKNLNSGQNKDKGVKKIYEICKALNGKQPSIKVLHFINGEKQSDRIAIEYDGAYYDINPTIQYLTLKKYRTPEEFKFNSEGYKLQRIMSTAEFAKEFEKYGQMMHKSVKEM